MGGSRKEGLEPEISKDLQGAHQFEKAQCERKTQELPALLAGQLETQDGKELLRLRRGQEVQ